MKNDVTKLRILYTVSKIISFRRNTRSYLLKNLLYLYPVKPITHTFSLVIVLFIFMYGKINSQNQDNEEILLQKISGYLRKCNTYESVLRVKQVIPRKHKHLLDSVFRYIPNMNPLNPATTDRLSSEFGYRLHPIQNTIKNHVGIDLAAEKGNYVYAPASGIVKNAQVSDEGYGKKITLLHGYGFETIYGHLSLILVKKRQKIKKGDVIGLVGSTGESTAPHLHYEVIKNNQNIDPLSVIDNELTKNETLNGKRKRR